jgi:hypothetical protein
LNELAKKKKTTETQKEAFCLEIEELKRKTDEAVGEA